MKQYVANLGGSGSGGGNSFVTISTPLGTFPVASGSATLVFTSSNSSVIITGDTATNTIDFTTSAGGGNVTGTTLTAVNQIPRWGNTTGSLLLTSAATISSAGVIAGSSIDAATNTITNILNASIGAAAAIAVNKLAALSTAKAVVTDGSGFLTTANPTTTEINFVAGVSLAIQTQLAARASLSFVTIQTPAGTSPVADGVNDTLTFASSSITITGDSSTDTVTFEVASGLTSAYTVIESQGVSLVPRSVLNFTGNGIAAVDQGGNRTNVSLNAGIYTKGFGVEFNGQGSIVAAGTTAISFQVPYGGTITDWTAWAIGPTGSIQYDVQKCSYANYPAGFSSIVDGAPPSIVNGVKGTTTTLTGWTLAFSAGDFFRFSVTSSSSLQWGAIKLGANIT